MVNESQPRLRRREIGTADLDGIVDLLVRGFPVRSRRYWERGLARMSERPVVEDCPRFGFMLDDGQRPVGVVLTLFDEAAPAGGRPHIRCNLSSWTVDPVYRMQAALLISSALRRRDVTYTNISPAPHTWPTIEAQGFRSYAAGRTLIVPALARLREPARVVRDPAAWRDLPEAGLLADHRRYGCTCLVVEAADGLHPFVFQPVRARSGRVPLPVVQLIHCRETAEFWRFAGQIGRSLATRGVIALVVDDAPPPGGPPVLKRLPLRPKYFRGPNPPRLGDLGYSELALFGP